MATKHTPGPLDLQILSVARSEDDSAVVLLDRDGRHAASAYGDRREEIARLIVASSEVVAALREFVDFAGCRQSNAAERKMLAEKFAQLGEKHRPLLARLGASPYVEDEGDNGVSERAAIAAAEVQS